MSGDQTKEVRPITPEDYEKLVVACDEAANLDMDASSAREAYLRLLNGRMRTAALIPSNDPAFSIGLAKLGRARGIDLLEQVKIDREDYRGTRVLSAEEGNAVDRLLADVRPEGSAPLTPSERYAALDAMVFSESRNGAGRREIANLVLARRQAARELIAEPSQIVRLGAECPHLEQQFLTDVGGNGKVADKFDARTSAMVSDYARSDADVVREMREGNIMAAEAMRARRGQLSEEILASPRALFMMGRSMRAPNARTDNPDFVVGRFSSDALDMAGRKGWGEGDVRGYEDFKRNVREGLEGTFDDPVERYAELRRRISDSTINGGRGKEEAYLREYARETARFIGADGVLVGKLIEKHEDLEVAFVRDAQPDDGGRRAVSSAKANASANTGDIREPSGAGAKKKPVLASEDEAEEKVINLFGKPEDKAAGARNEPVGARPAGAGGKGFQRDGGQKSVPRETRDADDKSVRGMLEQILTVTPAHIGQVVDIMRKGGDAILPLSSNSVIDAGVLAREMTKLVRSNPHQARDVYINTCMMRQSLMRDGKPINDEAAMAIKRLELGRRAMAEPIKKMNLALGGHRILKLGELNALAAFHGDTEIGSHSRNDITHEVNSSVVRDVSTMRAHFDDGNLNNSYLSLAISEFGASGQINREIAGLLKRDPQRAVEMYKNTVAKRTGLLDSGPLDPEARLAHDRLEMGRRALGQALVRGKWLTAEMYDSDKREFVSDLARSLPDTLKREFVEKKVPDKEEIMRAKDRAKRPVKTVHGIIDGLLDEVRQNAR